MEEKDYKASMLAEVDKLKNSVLSGDAEFMILAAAVFRKNKDGESSCNVCVGISGKSSERTYKQTVNGILPGTFMQSMGERGFLPSAHEESRPCKK